MEQMLWMHNVSKTFGAIQSLRQVFFSVDEGQVVGLLGDNGAGKSTLIKIITGYLQPDNGSEMAWYGEYIDHITVSGSREMGIEAVYQERALADNQPVWRNIFMGREITRYGILQKQEMRERTKELMSYIGFTSKAITPDTIVKTMSGGERQGIAIARALHFNARLVILDEPTMGLSISETRKVLEFVAAIKDSGRSCIFIDHNIIHVHPIADGIFVLDRGRNVDYIKKGEYTLEQLVDHLARIATKGE
jgi:simple sugar transport system ATP-binding protein